MPTITTSDGFEIFLKDWGSGSPIVFCHGWPLSSDDRDAQRHRQVVGLVVVPPGLVVVAVAATYKGYRYPIEVIGHAVWLYHRFALSLRDVEELMLARGVMLTYETIRSWCAPSSGRTMPTSCAGADPAPATCGTSTRSS